MSECREEWRNEKRSDKQYASSGLFFAPSEADLDRVRRALRGGFHPADR